MTLGRLVVVRRERFGTGPRSHYEDWKLHRRFILWASFTATVVSVFLSIKTFGKIPQGKQLFRHFFNKMLGHL